MGSMSINHNMATNTQHISGQTGTENTSKSSLSTGLMGAISLITAIGAGIAAYANPAAGMAVLLGGELSLLGVALSSRKNEGNVEAEAEEQPQVNQEPVVELPKLNNKQRKEARRQERQRAQEGIQQEEPAKAAGEHSKKLNRRQRRNRAAVIRTITSENLIPADMYNFDTGSPKKEPAHFDHPSLAKSQLQNLVDTRVHEPKKDTWAHKAWNGEMAQKPTPLSYADILKG